MLHRRGALRLDELRKKLAFPEAAGSTRCSTNSAPRERTWQPCLLEGQLQFPRGLHAPSRCPWQEYQVPPAALRLAPHPALPFAQDIETQAKRGTPQRSPLG